jgi:hypothetical protein
LIICCLCLQVCTHNTLHNRKTNHKLILFSTVWYLIYRVSFVLEIIKIWFTLSFSFKESIHNCNCGFPWFNLSLLIIFCLWQLPLCIGYTRLTSLTLEKIWKCTVRYPWTMKYYFYSFKNPTGRRVSVREFITRQTCTICDYTVDYMCRTKTIKSPHAFAMPRKTWRQLWHSCISKLFLTKIQVQFSIFFHRGSLNAIGDKFRFVRSKLKITSRVTYHWFCN